VSWIKPELKHNEMTQWNWMCSNPQHLKMGGQVDIGAFCYMNAHQGIILEDLVQIGSHCALISISTIDGKQGQIHIKRNAKIGTHSTIMPGVTVGENSVVGAHSFVNKDIPDNEMWWGVPASFRRFVDGTA
jgi:acetyltransferase-like isoleucine patch superfamily enzyme